VSYNIAVTDITKTYSNRKKINRTNMLWSVQCEQLNTTRKSRDEVTVGCCHDNRSFRDAHERLDGVPETTIITQNNVNLQIKPRRLATCTSTFCTSTLHCQVTITSWPANISSSILFYTLHSCRTN